MARSQLYIYIYLFFIYFFKLKYSIPFEGQWCRCINKQTDQLPNTVSIGNTARA